MFFEVIGDITEIETIAAGRKIRGFITRFLVVLDQLSIINDEVRQHSDQLSLAAEPKDDSSANPYELENTALAREPLVQ